MEPGPGGARSLLRLAEELADAIDAESLLEFGTGVLKWRRRRHVSQGYVSNGRHRYGTTLASSHLAQSSLTTAPQGGPYERL